MHTDKKKDLRIILYGAGLMGRNTYVFFKRLHMEHLILAFCDKKHEEIKQIGELPVKSYEVLRKEAREKGYAFIITHNVNMDNTVVVNLQKDCLKWYTSLEQWLYGNKLCLNRNLFLYKSNIFFFENITLREKIKFCIQAKNITGKYNIVELGKEMKWFNNKLNILGNFNYIGGGDASSIIDTEIRIDDDGNMIWIGKDTYVYKATISAGEGTTVTIGDGCLFAKNVTIRSLDGHKIFDLCRMNRINVSQNITIGDHVWLAEECMILKGAEVGKDVVVAAKAVVNKKIAADNCIIGGIPARVLKEGITWRI